MVEDKRNGCEVCREHLIELLLEGKRPPGDSEPGRHLSACPGCRSFWSTMNALQPAFSMPELYTPGLKYRTLKRLAAEGDSVDKHFLGLMIPAGFLGLLFWFATPVLLLAWVLDYWLSQPWVSLFIALLLLTSLGFLVGCLAFLALTQGRGAELLKGRMKDLLEGFYA